MGLINENVKVVGFDVFVVHQGGLPALPQEINDLKLTLISNRGTKVWPGPTPQIHMTDVYRCRYIAKTSTEKKMSAVSSESILSSLVKIENSGFEWVHVEKLLEIRGEAGYTKAQGE
jgi:hypothetical protein